MPRAAADKQSWFRSPPLGVQPLVIVLANLVPVIGVFFFDWEVFTILFLFWLENVIAGFFNVLKMRLMPAEVKFSANTPRAEIPFFILHYGFFMLGHGIFVFAMFLKPDSPADFFAAMAGRWLTLVVAFVSLIVEHGYAYYYDCLKGGEYKKPSKFPQFLKPYGRLVVMHVTIIFGGFGVQELGSPRPALLILIALKTLFDLGAWVVRLPDKGALGRIRGAFLRAAVAALVGVWCMVMCCGLPTAFIGKATAAVSRWVGGGQIGGDHWSHYGFTAGAVFAVILPAAVWWHHILGGLSRYREATKLTKTIAVGAILTLLFGAAAWPAMTAHRMVRAQIDAARAKANPTATKAPAAKPALPLSPSNLCRQAHTSSSSDWASDRGNAQFVAAKAFDGDQSTRWNSDESDAAGAWLAGRWDQPVTIQRIVVRQAFDRMVDFAIDRFDDEKNDWAETLNVFGARHDSAYLWSAEQGGRWGYGPDTVAVDGRRLEDHKDRVFGQDHSGSTHPVFTINLPEPLVTRGIRLRVKTTNARTISIFELEAY